MQAYESDRLIGKKNITNVKEEVINVIMKPETDKFTRVKLARTVSTVIDLFGCNKVIIKEKNENGK